MPPSPHPKPEEVEQLLLNAQLRDALEPYLDESIDRVNVRRLSTRVENEFLASMLAWERAPVLPISEWFEPELEIPHPDSFKKEKNADMRGASPELHKVLWDTIFKLYEKRIVLESTDHLTDRQLYCLIYRDILPSEEKKIDSKKNYLHWDCADMSERQETWLCYYASEKERQAWAEDHEEPLPPNKSPPYPRDLPKPPR